LARSSSSASAMPLPSRMRALMELRKSAREVGDYPRCAVGPASAAGNAVAQRKTPRPGGRGGSLPTDGSRRERNQARRARLAAWRAAGRRLAFFAAGRRRARAGVSARPKRTSTGCRRASNSAWAWSAKASACLRSGATLASACLRSGAIFFSACLRSFSTSRRAWPAAAQARSRRLSGAVARASTAWRRPMATAPRPASSTLRAVTGVAAARAGRRDLLAERVERVMVHLVSCGRKGPVSARSLVPWRRVFTLARLRPGGPRDKLGLPVRRPPMAAKKSAWARFPHDAKGFDYAGDKLKKAWPELHAGDAEPFPD